MSLSTLLTLAAGAGCGGGNSSGSGGGGGSGGAGTTSSSSSTASSSSSSTSTTSSSSAASSSSGNMAACVSLSFDGSTGVVNLAHVSVTAFTIEAWIKPMDVSGQRAIVTELVSNSFTNFELGIENGLPYFFVPDGMKYNKAQEMTALKAGQWYHLAGVYDGTTAWLTVNGALGMSTIKSMYKETPTPLYIGSRPGDKFFFSGEISEVRISSVARYKAAFMPQKGFTADADTVGLWSLDEDMGTTAADSSGKGNNGTIMGGATWTKDCP